MHREDQDLDHKWEGSGNGAEFEADKVAFGIAGVQKAVGQCGRCPAEAAQDLGAGEWLEAVLGCFGEEQLASFGEDEELAAGADERAEGGVLPRPLQLTGGEVEAAEVGLVPRFAVEGIEIFAEEDAGAEVVVEDFGVVNDLGPVVRYRQQRAAAAVGGDENAVAPDKRIRIVGVVAGFPREAPKFAARCGIESDQMFGGEDEDRFLAAVVE